MPGHPEAMKKSYRRDYFHTSAWKWNSPKSLCRILYRETREQPITLLSLILPKGSDYYILEGRIMMR